MTEVRAHRLAELSYPGLARILAAPEPSVALVPTGATEAHGPHLPLGTDTILAEGLAWRAAGRLAAEGVHAVVFPPLAYAVTTWAAGFPGTVGTSPPTFEALLLDVVLRAHELGFSAVGLVNAHLEPANVAVLRRVASGFEERTGRPLAFADQTRRAHARRLTEEFRSGSCHAGRYETSLVLALRPDLVDEEVRKALPEHFVPLAEHIARGADSFEAVGMDRAYCGAPADATAAEGEQTLAVQAEMTVEAVLRVLGRGDGPGGEGGGTGAAPKAPPAGPGGLP